MCLSAYGRSSACITVCLSCLFGPHYPFTVLPCRYVPVPVVSAKPEPQGEWCDGKDCRFYGDILTEV